jgi:hypothetical protein
LERDFAAQIGGIFKKPDPGSAMGSRITEFEAALAWDESFFSGTVADFPNPAHRKSTVFVALEPLNKGQ